MKVGDKLWLVRDTGKNRVAKEVAVTKVGRKYLELEGGYKATISTSKSLDLEGWYVAEGQYSYGTLYSSQGVYEQHTQLLEVWRELQSKVSRFGFSGPPDGVTKEDLLQVRALLRFT